MKTCLLLTILAAFLFPSEASSQKKPGPAKKPAVVKSTSAVPSESEVKKVYRAGDYSQAVSLAEARIKANPGDRAMMVVQALSYGMLRNKEMVLKTVSRIYNNNDTVAIFLSTMPYNLSKEVLKSDGAWYMAEAHKANPKSAIVYLMEASYLLDDSMYDKAKTAALAGSALLSDNDAMSIQTQYANVLQATGAKESAYALINKLQSAHPEDSLVVAEYYAMLLTDKRYSESLVELNHLINLQPGSEKRLRKERAYLYEDMGRHNEACAEASALNTLDPAFISLLRKLGCPEAYVSMSPETIKSYTYDVDYHGMKYKFVVMPRSINMSSSVVFDWSMSIRADMNGKITIGKSALDTAHGQMNLFEKGDKTLDRLTTVWVSNAVYNEIKKTGKTVMSASDQGAKSFSVVNDDPDDGPTVIDSHGDTKAFKVLHMRSDDQKEEIWINDDPLSPMITHMEIGWSIELKELN